MGYVGYSTLCDWILDLGEQPVQRIADILQHHPPEKPMGHAAWDALDTFLMEIEHVEGTYAPALIVTVLPVVHAVFPPIAVTSPPFACSIAVAQSPVGGSCGIGIATLVVDVAGSHAEIEYAAEGYPTDNERAAGIMVSSTSDGSKIDAVACIVSSAYVPDPCVPVATAHPAR